VPKISCKDLGGDCPFVVEAAEPEGAKRALLTHLRHVHRERASSMTEDEREALDARIDQVLRRR
jgi:predicted small metal-binding protein